MLEELERSRPEMFKRVMRDQAAKAAEEQEARVDHELAKKEDTEFHPVMWQGLADDDGGEEEEEQWNDEDNEGKRLKAAVVVLSSETMRVAKPKQAGAHFGEAMNAEAAAVTSRLRRKAPVEYGKERLGLAGLDIF